MQTTDNITGEIIDLIRKGDHKGYVLLSRQYGPLLYGVISGLVSDKKNADELLVCVMIKIWKDIEEYDPSKLRFCSWTMNIARSLSIVHLQQSTGKRKPDCNVSQPIFNLVCHHGLNVSEIALLLNVTVKEAMTMLRNEIRELKPYKP